jgi:hypothetical protein
MELDEEADMMAALAADIVAERDAEMRLWCATTKHGLSDDPALHRAYLQWRFPD